MNDPIIQQTIKQCSPLVILLQHSLRNHEHICASLKTKLANVACTRFR